MTLITKANKTNAYTNTYNHGCTLSQQASSKNSFSQNGRDWPSHIQINQRRHRINIQQIHIHVENEACTHKCRHIYFILRWRYEFLLHREVMGWACISRTICNMKPVHPKKVSTQHNTNSAMRF